MNPILKIWFFENWLEDQKDDVEIVKNHAYLLGSFWNPEAVKKLTGESGSTFTSSDEEFEKSTQLVIDERNKQKPNKKNKRRRKIRE